MSAPLDLQSSTYDLFTLAQSTIPVLGDQIAFIP